MVGFCYNFFVSSSENCQRLLTFRAFARRSDGNVTYQIPLRWSAYHINPVDKPISVFLSTFIFTSFSFTIRAYSAGFNWIKRLRFFPLPQFQSNPPFDN